MFLEYIARRRFHPDLTQRGTNRAAPIEQVREALTSSINIATAIIAAFQYPRLVMVIYQQLGL